MSLSNVVGALRPRRMLVATVVGVAVWVVLGPLTGIAIAREPGETPWPHAWQVPPPRAGDAGQYRRVGPDGVSDDGFDFRWTGPFHTLLPDGRLGLAFQLDLWDVVDSVRMEESEVVRFDEGGTLLSVGRQTAYARESDCEANAVPCHATSKGISVRLEHRRDAALPVCGLVNELQRRAVETTGTFRFSGPCGVHLNGLDATIARFWSSGGLHRAHILAVGADETERLDLTMRADIPYPLEFASADEEIRLVAFRPGTIDMALPLAVGVLDPGPVEMLPRTPWGPSEDGFRQQFPLSKAIKMGRENEPALDVYLLTHPDAYVASATHIQDVDGRILMNLKMIFEWTIVLTDGKDHFAARVRAGGNQAEAMLGSVTAEVLPRPAGPYPAPTLLPAEMPTARDLVERYGAYLGYTYQTPTPDELKAVFPSYGLLRGGVGIDVSCVGTGCEAAHVEYHSCWNHRVTWNETRGDGVATGGRTTTCAVRFDEAGNVVAFESDYREEETVRGSAPSSTTPAGYELTPMTASAPISPSATRVAAGAGIASVVAALAYWLWPFARNLFGLGMFTRIERPKILENRTRAELLVLIEGEPGIHFSELRRRVGLAHGTIMHHLRMLEANQLLTAVKLSGRTCYFAQRPGPQQKNAALAASRHRQRFLSVLAERPDATLSMVARTLNLRRQTIHESSRRMARDGLIGVGTGGRVTITERGLEALRGARATQRAGRTPREASANLEA